MGRKPQNPKAIPRFRARKQKSGKVHYYYDCGGKPRKEMPLGSDYGMAIKKWAELEQTNDTRSPEIITFRYVSDKYRVEIIPTKAPRTQIDNLAEIAKLLEFFDDPPAPLDVIEPQHIRQFLTWRGQTAKSRANREKALFSAIWNYARDKGYTAMPNPCAGIKGFTEKGRDVYIEDDVYKAVWDAACEPLRDAMDLAYLTGQRPSDVLKMQETDIRGGYLEVSQNKTSAKLRIEISDELFLLLNRIKSRKRLHPVRNMLLIVDESGRHLPIRTLQDRFDRARAKAGISKETFQFRDLRAKAGTDKADAVGDIRQAQKQLGHTTVGMTEHYVRNRKGAKVTPTK